MDQVLAAAVLSVHLAWIAWVILGWTVTRRHRLLRWLHVGSLVYSILIEVSRLPCPLTLAETCFERRAGMKTYHQPFLVHYFEAVIYPDVPPAALTAVGVAVCAAILGNYVCRWRKREA